MYDKRIYQKLDKIIQDRKKLQLKQEKKKYARFNVIFNYCLSALSYEYQKILRKSYFEDEYKFWWVDEYSKTAYYRKRIKAVTSFVKLFELINENFDNFSSNSSLAY